MNYYKTYLFYLIVYKIIRKLNELQQKKKTYQILIKLVINNKTNTVIHYTCEAQGR